MDISIGIMAYNEGGNIKKLLESLLSQKISSGRIVQVVVVASGCTDDTEGIVKRFSNQDSRVQLITQREREGKASAVNLYLKNVKGDIVVLESADTLPAENAIENLVKPFADERVGMVGGHPVPVDGPNTLLGFSVQLIWRLHHEISRIKPKAGELVAFRNIIKQIPKNTAADEAWIESMVTKKGYILAYAPDAIVKNKGPETVLDLIRQRKRIYIGHLHLKKNQDYAPLTMDALAVLKVVLKHVELNPTRLLFLVMAVLLEAYSRASAIVDFYVLGRNPYRWEIAKTTKNLKNV